MAVFGSLPLWCEGIRLAYTGNRRVLCLMLLTTCLVAHTCPGVSLNIPVVSSSPSNPSSATNFVLQSVMSAALVTVFQSFMNSLNLGLYGMVDLLNRFGPGLLNFFGRLVVLGRAF